MIFCIKDPSVSPGKSSTQAAENTEMVFRDAALQDISLADWEARVQWGSPPRATEQDLGDVGDPEYDSDDLAGQKELKKLRKSRKKRRL